MLVGPSGRPYKGRRIIGGRHTLFINISIFWGLQLQMYIKWDDIATGDIV
jgi:hypothetical protein